MTSGSATWAAARVTALLKQLSSPPADERRAAGQVINTARDQLTAALDARRDALEAAALQAAISAGPSTSPCPDGNRPGGLHPLPARASGSRRSSGRGFAVHEGPEIEDDFYNFTALNIPGRIIRRGRCTTRSISPPASCCVPIPRRCRSAPCSHRAHLRLIAPAACTAATRT